MKFSVVVAVFKRRDELEELLESLILQIFKDFEVVVSDGSPDTSLKDVVQSFESKLNLNYVYRKGYKASESRNEGCKQAKGAYFIFLDSDIIAPPDYLSKVDAFLTLNPVDAFGGPDAAREDFTPVMKAINFAMTSIWTTGGIRGRKKKVGKFQLRGFNMGISKAVFEATGGFSTLQVAEDIELSVRIEKAGFKAALIDSAFVFHKRKSSFDKFFKQLTMHGRGRVDLNLRHPGQIKPVHWIPTAFLVALLTIPILYITSKPLGLALLSLVVSYLGLLCVAASFAYRSIRIGIMSVWASVLMLVGYGYGLASHYVLRIILSSGNDTNKSEELKL